MISAQKMILKDVGEYKGEGAQIKRRHFEALCKEGWVSRTGSILEPVPDFQEKKRLTLTSWFHFLS